MSPRPSAALAVLLFLVATLALPLAAADHAYSHRYIVYGRVVDANGDPVPGLTVNLRQEGLTDPAPCGNQPGTDTEAFGVTRTSPVTTAFGEWTYCFHTHGMSRAIPGTAHIEVAGMNFTTDIDLDPYTRVSFVPIQLAQVVPEANKEAAATTYTVYARLWRPEGGEPTVEGIRVFGRTLDHVPVNITLALPDGTTVTRTATTNSYGDVAVRLNVTARVTAGTVTIEAEGQSFTDTIDASDSKLGISSFKAEYPKKTDPVLRTLGIVVGVIVGGAVLVGGGIYATRKMREKREVERVRAGSQRKRANK